MGGMIYHTSHCDEKSGSDAPYGKKERRHLPQQNQHDAALIHLRSSLGTLLRRPTPQICAMETVYGPMDRVSQRQARIETVAPHS